MDGNVVMSQLDGNGKEKDPQEDEEEVDEENEDEARKCSQEPHVTEVDATQLSSEAQAETPKLVSGSQLEAGENSGHLTPSQSVTSTTVVPESDLQSALSNSVPPPTSAPTSAHNKSAVQVSTRASSRTVAKSLGRQDEDPKYWSFDAGCYLKKALGRFGGEEAVYWLKELDNSLQFPKGNVRTLLYLESRLLIYSSLKGKALKLDAAQQPPGVKQWASGGKEFDRVPSKVSDSSQFYRELLAWYRSLLPPSRRSIWPPPRNTLVEPNEWIPLSKSTANGFFILLLSVSWLPSLSPPILDNDIRVLVEELTWSLKEITASVKQGSVSAGSKRKSAGKPVGPSKKKRTS